MKTIFGHKRQNRLAILSDEALLFDKSYHLPNISTHFKLYIFAWKPTGKHNEPNSKYTIFTNANMRKDVLMQRRTYHGGCLSIHKNGSSVYTTR